MGAILGVQLRSCWTCLRRGSRFLNPGLIVLLVWHPEKWRRGLLNYIIFLFIRIIKECKKNNNNSDLEEFLHSRLRPWFCRPFNDFLPPFFQWLSKNCERSEFLINFVFLLLFNLDVWKLNFGHRETHFTAIHHQQQQ